MSRKFAVVTTFNKAGMDLYGQKMIDSFEKNWPAEVDLYVYAEGCTPNKTRNNTYVRELMQNAGIVKFKAKWKDVPKANGLENPKGRVDSHKGFKWDAIRFCHKVFAIFDCAKSLDGSDVDELIWMDADTLCHSAMLFTMKEWHDSFVFYEIVKEFRQVQGFVEHSLSNVTIQGEGHPIINSKLGAYIDHMKGNRKVDGKSYAKDLKVERKEDYWK